MKQTSVLMNGNTFAHQILSSVNSPTLRTSQAQRLLTTHTKQPFLQSSGYWFYNTFLHCNYSTLDRKIFIEKD